MSKITYNTKLLFVKKEDNQNVINMLEAAKFCWNECSKVKFEKVPKNSIIDLHKEFYREFRNKYPYIKASIVINIQRDILSTYRSIKTNKQIIKSPCFKYNLSLRMACDTCPYKNYKFSVLTLNKRVKCKPYLYPKLEEFISKYTFCDPLLFVKNNEVWIAITFNIPELKPQQALALGVDLGCRINAATSEGNLFVDKKFNGRKRQLRYLKDQLKSKGTPTAQKHLRKLRHKERDINKNFTHHLANKILDTKADVIVLENLKSIKVKKDFKNKNRISQVPFFNLKRILTYKALLQQKTVIEVCPAWTSQIDHKTGKKDGKRQGRRYYSKDGPIYDSDINAAINIAQKVKLPISLGGLAIQTYGQAKVNTPIVSFGL